MVDRLLAAAAEELERVGPEALSIRVVAQQAGMSPATAYSYLASKDHLFAELLWRRLATDRGPELPNSTATERLSLTIEHFIRLIREAIGDGADPRLLDIVSMTFFGALLQAGMGLGSYEECGRRLQDAVAVILKGAG